MPSNDEFRRLDPFAPPTPDEGSPSSPQDRPLDAAFVEGPFDAIQREVEALQSPKSNWSKTILGLVVSVLLFATAGWFQNPALDMAVLVGVLFVHESGHFLGMKLFGYRNVRMFFIPMFGAAVSGRRTSVESYQEAIVLLMGPVPGLVIGYVLLASFLFVNSSPILKTSAILFIVINAFNLLPLTPMDGGRVLQATLFSRNRFLEAIVQVLAGLGLLGLAWAMKSWVFGVIGFSVISVTKNKFKISTLAGRLRDELAAASSPTAGLLGPPGVDPVAPWLAGGDASELASTAAIDGSLNRTDKIPPPLLVEIVLRLGAAFPEAKAPKPIAGLVVAVWDKLVVRPPGALATLALLMTYAFFFASVFVVPALLLAVQRALLKG